MGLNLEINNLSFSYNGYPALEDVKLDLGPGEVLGIVGPNGSGKSTLLKCMNRILKTKQNTVLIDGKDVRTIGLRELAKMMGYVPQNSRNIFPFTVDANSRTFQREFVGVAVVLLKKTATHTERNVRSTVT